MFLHLGKNETVKSSEIIGIFDLEGATLASGTRLFLKRMEAERKTVSLCDKIPKTFILCDNIYTDTLYITQISPISTAKRAENFNFLTTDNETENLDEQ